jgi:hypothetical protein
MTGFSRDQQSSRVVPSMGRMQDELSSRTRQDNSLGELTRKFIALIQESENKSVDLNDAAKKLEV